MKRLFHNDAGEGTTLLGKLYLTPRQRSAVLKWALYALTTLMVLVLQDVVFSRLSLLGGTVCLTHGLILLIGLIEGPNAGSVFAMAAGTFWALSGQAMGSLSLLVLTVEAAVLGAFLLAYLRRGFWPLMACCALGLLVYEAAIFLGGVFLSYTTLSRWLSFLSTALTGCLGCMALYPLAAAIAKIGGIPWNER